MITVKKTGNESYPDIEISDGVNIFNIARNNCPDSYWYPEVKAFMTNEDIVFVFAEEDGDIYTLFNQFYEDIVTGNVFPLSKADLAGKSVGEVRRLKLENAEEQARYKIFAEQTELIKDGVMEWHSQDYDPYEFASILRVEKIDNKIRITFIKNKEHQENPNYLPSYYVRLSESGGIYSTTYYHCIFVRLHRALQRVDWPVPDVTNDPAQFKKSV